MIDSEELLTYYMERCMSYNRSWQKSLVLPLIVVLSVCAVLPSSAQPEDQIRIRILEEGKYLFRLEKASWHATDVLLKNNHKLIEQLEGYLSYTEADLTRTIFWNKSNRIVFSVDFDSVASENKAIADTSVRDATSYEGELIALRKQAWKLLSSNDDKFFAFYEKTEPNLIPFVRNGERVVFILTGATENILLVGNDYKLVFDEANRLKTRTKLHNSLIRIQSQADDSNTVGSIHTHIVEDQPLMTSTDICTFLLYRELLRLNKHTVISDKWISIFDADKVSLVIVPKEAFHRK